MSNVKNDPKYKNGLLQAIRAQLEHRAFWLYLLCDEAKKKGLAGMECYYSTYDEATTALALHTVAELGLKPSGGSDFHGALKPDIRLGVGHGNLKIPYAWACALCDK